MSTSRATRGDIGSQLDRIAGEFVDAVQRARGELPTAEADAEWPSRCVQGNKDATNVYWRPVPRRGKVDFSGIETALETTIPQALHKFYSRFWSGSIPVIWGDRPFELLQLWNEDDETNLLHNFLGHAVEKKRVREKLTLFFALIDDVRFLSCDVESGAVMLEELGGERPVEVAASLEALLGEVTGAAGAGEDPSGA